MSQPLTYRIGLRISKEDSLATPVLLNVIFALRAPSCVGLHPLRCSSVLSSILDPDIDELADKRAVVRI